MKKLMYLVLFLTVFISVGLGEEVIPSMEAQADTLAQPTPINQIFPDSNFATVVAESFEPDKNVNDVVTSTDLSSVITVSGGNRNIQSIEGVQYLTGVRHLDLFSNYINNISPLANADLPNLVRLDLGYNQVSDFSPLISGDFPQFFSLNLQNNHINDISFLADVDFPLLNSLFLGGNQINDLTPLENAHFPILKTLELNTNEVRDIRPLTNGNFPEMTRLKLEENQIDDISSLASADFTKLEYLYLDDNQIMDISSLASADIPEISSLGLAHNQIADITPLANANCSKVEHLFLQNNQIANIEPLENATFTNLFSVYLENQTIINEPIPYQRTLTIENVVTTIDGSIVPPASITNGGQYTNPTIEWSLPNFIGEVSYTFNEPLSIGTWIYDSFSGTVIQPLAAPLATQEVVFNVDGIETREEVGIGAQLTEPAAPTKEGYTFTGWYDAPTGGNPWDFTTGKMPANDLTLYAQFTKNRYQVTFTIDGETTLQLMDYEAQLTEPAAPTKEGYTFTGWYDAPTGGNPWDFTTGKMPANDLTLYAQFTKNRYQVTFTIDGETTLQLMDYEAQLTEPAAPTKEGYTFTGWYDAPTGGNPWDFTTGKMPANDLTLYAQFTKNCYQVTFTIDGETTLQLMDYEAQLTEPAAPTKEGYTFTGWYDAPTGGNPWDFTTGKMPANDLTLYAQFTQNNNDTPGDDKSEDTKGNDRKDSPINTKDPTSIEGNEVARNNTKENATELRITSADNHTTSNSAGDKTLPATGEEANGLFLFIGIMCLIVSLVGLRPKTNK